MDNYISAGKIYKIILDKIICKILYFLKSNTNCFLTDICDYGNKLIEEASCTIALPVTISLNNCIGYFYDTNREIILKESDIIKIEFGINIKNCIVNGCDTFIIKDKHLSKDNKYIKFLDKLQNKIIRKILPKEILVEDSLYQEGYITTDDIRMLIESNCTKNRCFPLQNSTSYQHNKHLGLDKWSESKKIILNYKKQYDKNDYLLELNNCDFFENGEVYTININIIPDEDDNVEKIFSKDEFYICRLNEYNYNLKLRNSRNFFSKIRNKHSKNAFYITNYNDPKEKLGQKECFNNGILDKYMVNYCNKDVFSKKFTIYINETGCILLN